MEYDASNETFSLIKDIFDWIYQSRNIYSLGIDDDKIYNAHVESTLGDFKKRPGKVYHYTTEEKWEEIKSDGKMIGSYGTGLTNRSVRGIFTSTDPEEHAIGTYGNVLLEIDLQKFKDDTGLEELNLEFEPEVMEYLAREYVVSVLEINEPVGEPSRDMSPYTVIVNHNIPVKYIRRL